MIFPPISPQVTICFYACAVPKEREELVRVRLSASDLDRAAAIQDYLKGIGQHDSLGAAVSKALGSYYLELVAEGVVPPNL